MAVIPWTTWSVRPKQPLWITRKYTITTHRLRVYYILYQSEYKFRISSRCVKSSFVSIKLRANINLYIQVKLILRIVATLNHILLTLLNYLYRLPNNYFWIKKLFISDTIHFHISARIFLNKVHKWINVVTLIVK